MSSEIEKKEIKKDRVKIGRVGDVKPAAQPVKTQYEKDMEELERLKQEVREDMKRHLKTPFVKRNYDFHKSSIAPEYFERFELYIYSACLIHPYPLCWKRLPDGRVTVFVRPHNKSILCANSP
ncbi:uncharacterized protein LOC124645402 [Helicoverpa zea]|uniref:uncharacterized protein LOC124645402 n=1 Tax=Helicoverpa zea TaxID=7113 RepID=UPI001F5A6F27|nr:uncharacterized protein LOC124645402 [Helicoverpa zea]